MMKFLIILLVISITNNIYSQDGLIWFKGKDYKKVINNSIILNDNQNQLISQKIGHAKIIGLGEATHGTKEIFELKSELIKDLISNHDFNILAFEAPYSELFEVNEYINSRSDLSKDSILLHFSFWIWMTPEVLDLVLWMKNYNIENKNRIKIAGIDVQGYRGILNRLEKKVKNKGEKELEKNLVSLKNELEQIKKYRRKNKIDLLESSSKNSVINKIKNLEHEIIDKLKTSTSTTYLKEEFKHLKIYVDFLFNGKTLYRDKLMSDNVKSLIKNNKTNKLILWAHNVHLDKNESSNQMGYHIHKTYGAEFINIAITFENGTCSTINNNSKERTHKCKPPSYTSIENLSSKINLINKGVLIDIKNVIKRNKRIRNFFINVEIRAIGAAKPTREFYKCNLINGFNYVICLKNTSPTKTL